MGKDIEPPNFSWGEQTVITEAPKFDDTKAPKFDDFEESVSNLINSVRKRPTPGGYMTLIGMILDEGKANITNGKVLDKLLDKAKKVIDEFNEWKRSKNQSDK